MPYKRKTDQSASAKRHYQRNKQSMIQRVSAFKVQAKERNYTYVNAYKAAKGCSRCPMRDPRCLDFHHLGDKTMNIAQAVINTWSLERLQKEIEKCIVLCANCHRIETRELQKVSVGEPMPQGLTL